MKNKKMKNVLLFVMLISVSMFAVQDVSAEKITGTFSVGAEAKIGNSGLPGTRLMTFTANGNTYNAYCAWYERGTPQPGTITLTPISKVNDKHAMAVANIINTSLVGKAGMPSDSTSTSFKKVQQVIKTAAINIYLSWAKESAGTAGGDYDRYNAADFVGGVTVTKDYYPINYFLVKDGKKDFDGLLSYFNNCETSEFVTGGHADAELCGPNSSYKTANKKYYKIVYDLFNTAKDVKYTQATLKFTNEEEDFTLANGWYNKTYKATSNKNLTSISAKVTGVDSSCYNVSGGKTNGTTGSVTVKIKQDCVKDFESLSEIKVEAEATTTDKKAILYTAANGVNISRTDYQDIVIADLGVEPIKVSTSDVIDRLYRTCYRNVITCDTTQCVNTNKNNTRTCTSKVEKYEAPSCDSNDTSNNASGKYTYELVSGKCSLYCTETATVSYPGNVRPAITIGTNFAWPTEGDDSRYPLTTNATLTCKIEMNANTTAADQNACINAAKNGNYKYENTKSGNIVYDNIANSVSVPLEQNCTSSQSVNGTSVTIYNKCSYTLPKGNSIAIDKKTADFIDKTTADFSTNYTNEILIKKYNGVLPIEGINWKGNINFKKDYNLEVSNLALGNQGQFTAVLNDNNFAYVCNYKVTTLVGGGCQCPPGTEYAGYDVLGNINGQVTNCADAKEIYCNKGPIYCTKEDGTQVDITSCLSTKTQTECIKEKCPRYCPQGTKYEGTRLEDIPGYVACKKSGGKDDVCIKEACDCGPNCEYYCPDDTPNKGLDISECVESEKGKGNNLVQAKKICVEEWCNDTGIRLGDVIYRTISLENPFPSIDADKKTSQTGLTVGLFNDTIKGRYPGSNWNSSKLVKDKILNNRGYDGSAIYQEAEPLYVIELDAKAIKEIRDYNKKQIAQSDGYADFTLKCTDGAYCISSFLHNNQIRTSAGKEILTGGTCRNASNKKTFINCYKYK